MSKGMEAWIQQEWIKLDAFFAISLNLILKTSRFFQTPLWPEGLIHQVSLQQRLTRSPTSRNKCLLISWQQSPSAVILEPPKIKSVTVPTVSPSISHEVMGPDGNRISMVNTGRPQECESSLGHNLNVIAQPTNDPQMASKH